MLNKCYNHVQNQPPTIKDKAIYSYKHMYAHIYLDILDIKAPSLRMGNNCVSFVTAEITQMLVLSLLKAFSNWGISKLIQLLFFSLVKQNHELGHPPLFLLKQKIHRFKFSSSFSLSGSLSNYHHQNFKSNINL